MHRMKDNPDEEWNIESDGEGCHFMVKVTAGAKRNHAGGIYQGALQELKVSGTVYFVFSISSCLLSRFFIPIYHAYFVITPETVPDPLIWYF